MKSRDKESRVFASIQLRDTLCSGYYPKVYVSIYALTDSNKKSPGTLEIRPFVWAAWSDIEQKSAEKDG